MLSAFFVFDGIIVGIFPFVKGFFRSIFYYATPNRVLHGRFLLGRIFRRPQRLFTVFLPFSPAKAVQYPVVFPQITLFAV